MILIVEILWYGVIFLLLMRNGMELSSGRSRFHHRNNMSILEMTYNRSINQKY